VSGFDSDGWRFICAHTFEELIMSGKIVVRCVGIAAIVVGLMACQEARAQNRRGGGRMGGMQRGVSPLTVAASPAVQKELGLSEDKAAKIKDLTADIRQEMQDLREAANLPAGGRDASPEDRQKIATAMAEIQKKVNDKFLPKLNDILDKNQQTRLHEIAIQAAGAGALQDAAVVKDLALTKEQQDKIAAVIKESRGRGPGGGGADAAAIRERRAEQLAKVTEVLTKDQQAQFAKMQGKQFDVSQLFAGRGQRRRRNTDNNN